MAPDISYHWGERPLHQYLRMHARKEPNRPAIIWYGQVITYGQLNDWSDRVARLLTSWGITIEDRVALYLGNCPQFIMTFLGVQKIGGIITPVSPAFKEWELQYQLNHSGSRVIILPYDRYSVFEAVRLTLKWNA